MALGLSDIEVGTHCLEYTHPEFRQQAKNGQQVIVAGKAFGCGSSREQAVNALKGNPRKSVSEWYNSIRYPFLTGISQ